MGENSINDFGDFLNAGVGLYSSYLDAQKTDDQVKIAAAQAAANAAAAQKEFAISDRAKKILLWGTVAVLVIGLGFWLLKKFK